MAQGTPAKSHPATGAVDADRGHGNIIGAMRLAAARGNHNGALVAVASTSLLVVDEANMPS